MKRTLLVIVLLALLSVSVLALHTYKTPFDAPRRYGVERVTHYDPRVNFARINTIVYLAPGVLEDFRGAGRGGYAPFYGRAAARVSSSTWYGFPRARVDIKTKDLIPSDEINAQYEAWLVDKDTGYRLSLGTFTTLFGGVGELWWKSDTYYLDPYDLMEITVEPYDDTDVLPGEVVLVGAVPPPNLPIYFNPPPKSAKMVTETIRNY